MILLNFWLIDLRSQLTVIFLISCVEVFLFNSKPLIRSYYVALVGAGNVKKKKNLRAGLALPGTVHYGTSMALTLSRARSVVREQVWWAVLYE